MIISRNQLIKSKKTEVGGKGAGLIDLQSRGFEVPAFFILPSENLWKFVSKSVWSSIAASLLQRTISVAEASEKMNKAIDQIQVTDQFREQLQLEISGLKAKSVAVRSSVADEDGATQSFAGQMDSFLFQENLDDVIGSIKKVWKSAFSVRVLEYRFLHQLSVADIQVSVIVQKMVNAEISGVIFTANPSNGDRNEVVISAALGVGEGIVSGEVDCDEILVDLKTNQIQKKIAGVQCVLSDQQVLNLVKISGQLADQRQEPLDIEWSMAHGQLYFLQARPVTSESVRLRHDNEKKVYDNSNIQESFCGITLPLTFSFASQSYEQVYSQLMKVMGFSQADVLAHQVRHRNMLSYINGRVYYNIRSWYDGLRFLPSFGRNKSDMERMMGVEYPVEFVEDQKLNLIEKAKRFPRMLLIVIRLSVKFVQIKSLVRKFDLWFECEYNQFPRAQLYRMNSQQLVNLIRQTKGSFLSNWAVPIINDFYVMMNNGKVYRVLKAVGLEKEQPSLLFGEKLESTEPTKRILEISEMIGRNGFAKELLNSAENAEQFFAELKSRFPAIADGCDKYIQRYGDRVIGELKLESKSLREDKEFLFQLLYNSQNRKLVDLESKEVELRKNAEAQVFAAIQNKFGRLKLMSFKSDLKKLRQGIVFREQMRMSRTRVFGLFRDLYLEIGKQWTEMGLLKNQRDIFYLTEDEIEQKTEARFCHQDLMKLVEIRKQEFSSWAEIEPAGHFVSRTPWLSDQEFKTPVRNVKAELTGLGCFPGIVKGQVEVVMSATNENSQKLNLAGKILVTMRTDPGWAPLFVNISGLIVERGSALSHSAVVARELGIPTIVGVFDVTQKLKSGDLIEFDGQEGWIRRADKQHLRAANESDQSASL